jgi:hypothetical protein
MRTFLEGNPTINAIVAAVAMVSLLLISYSAFEPIVAQGGTASTTDTFTVRQQIAGEISFTSPANDVTMTPSIGGILGGTAYGTSTFAVSTNNPTGYNITIRFASTTAMLQETGSSSIANYTPAGGVPDATFAVGANTGEFGYTVNAPSASLPVHFNNNGGTCGEGTDATPNTCWWNQADATSARTIINSSVPTIPTGATTTLVFQVGITANPSPAIPAGFYTATATLTATENL